MERDVLVVGESLVDIVQCRRRRRSRSTPAAAPPTWPWRWPGSGGRCGSRPASPRTTHGGCCADAPRATRASRWRPTRASSAGTSTARGHDRRGRRRALRVRPRVAARPGGRRAGTRWSCTPARSARCSSPGADDVFALLRAAARATRRSATTSTPGPRSPAPGRTWSTRVERMAGIADLVKASDEDLEALYPELDLATAAPRLLALGPAAVVVTRGGDGAIWVGARPRRRGRLRAGRGGRHHRRRRHLRGRPRSTRSGSAGAPRRGAPGRRSPSLGTADEIARGVLAPRRAGAGRGHRVAGRAPDPPYRARGSLRPESSTGAARRARAARRDAPSPLAAATRFIEPERMSPTAKTPGTVVARLSGGRPSTHRSLGTSRPVSTKPRSSRATSSGSQSQCGSAPSSRNSPRAATPLDARRCVVSAHVEPLQAPVAAAVDDLGAGADRDPGVVVDLVDQVAATSSRPGSAGAPGSSPTGRTGPGGSRPGRRSCRRRRPRRRAPPSRGPRSSRAVVDARADQLLDAGRRAACGRRRRWRPRPTRARTSPPSVRSDVRGAVVARARARSTSQPVKNRVPNRIAWLRARWASRMPEMPRGKPR